MNIQGVNYNLYLQQNTNKSAVISKPAENKFVSSPVSQFYYPVNINFKSSEIRPPSKESTLKELDRVYDNYHNSLMEISEEDIKNTIDSINIKTGISKEKITDTMHKITQYANLNSIITISNALKKYDIGEIANSEIIPPVSYEDTIDSFNFGLNSTLDYLILHKKFGNLNNHSDKVAIFLDNNKLEQLENLKLRDPRKFVKIINNPKNCFFTLSGFNNGVNIFNINDNLEDKTIEALKHDDIDEEVKSRAENLGIKPIMISNLKPEKASINSIYNNLKPLQITKDEMLAVIDANVMLRQKTLQDKIDTKTDIVQYLDNTFDVYSPKRLSVCLKKTYKDIEAYAKSKGKTMDDVEYIIPEAKKSYEYINYQYQQVNNIPKKQFKYMYHIPHGIDFKKINVILDDCSISGNSVQVLLPDIYYKMNLYGRGKGYFVFAPLYCDNLAKEMLKDSIEEHGREKKDIVINQNKKVQFWDRKVHDADRLKNSLGEPCFNTLVNNDIYPSIIFPYMAPDNDTEIASNIALFHSPVYRNNPEIGYNDLYTSIKSYSHNAQEVTKLTHQLLESNN